MSHEPYRTPSLPTREWALYVAAARVYVESFRAVFVDPTGARRRFRRAAELDQGRALGALFREPDLFGPRRLHHFASAVHDPAFIYWTHRERRPRTLLLRVAELLYEEAARRDHIQRAEQAREDAARADSHARALRDQRVRRRARARDAVEYAGHVYKHPARACRVMLWMVRRHGTSRTRALLAAWPEFFGPLRTVRCPRGVWPLLLVFVTTDEARGWVSPFLANAFDPAAAARASGRRSGALRRADHAAEAAQQRFRHLSETVPESGALREAARLLAVLFRRRDVDEKPQGKGPPAVERQLAVILPACMTDLIEEAVRLSQKESGEDPVWQRERVLTRERSRGWGRERGREGGLSR